eukprot:gene3875-4234_t
MSSLPAANFVDDAERARLKHVPVQNRTLALSLDKFLELFFLEGAPFNSKIFRESAQDRDVEMTAWQETSPGQYQREQKFVKPMSIPGISKTRGITTQTMKRYEDAGWLIFSSTDLFDVPAAGCFVIEDVLEVKVLGPELLSLTHSYRVNFIKSTIMKIFVNMNSQSEMDKLLPVLFDFFEKNAKSGTADAL